VLGPGDGVGLGALAERRGEAPDARRVEQEVVEVRCCGRWACLVRVCCCCRGGCSLGSGEERGAVEALRRWGLGFLAAGSVAVVAVCASEREREAAVVKVDDGVSETSI